MNGVPDILAFMPLVPRGPFVASRINLFALRYRNEIHPSLTEWCKLIVKWFFKNVGISSTNFFFFLSLYSTFKVNRGDYVNISDCSKVRPTPNKRYTRPLVHTGPISWPGKTAPGAAPSADSYSTSLHENNQHSYWTDTYKNKPVDELARVLLSFKRPIFAIELQQCRLLAIFTCHLAVGYAECFFSQSSKPNELIFKHSVLRWCVLKGSVHTDSWSGSYSFQIRRLWRLWLHEYDIIVTRRHQWRHQSTRCRHFPIGSLLDTSPLISGCLLYTSDAADE